MWRGQMSPAAPTLGLDDDNAARCAILHGFYSGLQNSVLRHEVFGEHRFEAESRNEAEDQLFVIWALARGLTLAYFDSVHVIYRLHAANSSAAGPANDAEKCARILHLLAQGYERVLQEGEWRLAERRAFRRRLQREYFWKLGYATLWTAGRRTEAFAMFRRGIHHWPWDWSCWKTLILAVAKLYVDPEMKWTGNANAK